MGKPLLKKKKGKPLIKRPPKPEDTAWPKSSSLPTPVLPPWPKVLGDPKLTKQVTSRKDVLIVSKRPDHPGYPKLNDERVPPGTYYVVNKNTYALEALMTYMPGDLRVAWDDCGECHQSARHCRCRGGIFVSRSIEYIYDKSVADEAKEEWNYHHPNYKGSFRIAQRQKFATARPRWVSSTPAPMSVGQSPRVEAPAKPAKPGQSRTATPSGSGKAPRKLLRKANGVAKPDTAAQAFSGNSVDRKTVDAAAASSTKSSTDELKKALGGKKLLRKKGK